MKQLKLLALALIAALSFASCDNDEIPEGAPNLLVLNNGNWGANDANILGYDTRTETATPFLFQKANGQQLGDLGQDIIAVGDKFYIAVNGSQVVFVTDRDLHIVQRIEATENGTRLSPRYLCCVDKKVYVTYYEGYLGEINTKDYSVRTTAVGNSPEGLAYVDGYIYVANSGGALFPNYDKTVSVVDAKTFAEVRKIDVNLNPQNVIASADGHSIYVNSFGNYGDVPAIVERIAIDDPNYSVSALDYTDVKAITAGKDNDLYVVTGGYDENWQVQGTVNVYNMKDRKQTATFPDAITNFYSISYSGGNVFVGTSDYKTNGDVIMYDRTGLRLATFDAQGLNPQRVVRL